MVQPKVEEMHQSHAAIPATLQSTRKLDGVEPVLQQFASFRRLVIWGLFIIGSLQIGQLLWSVDPFNRNGNAVDATTPPHVNRILQEHNGSQQQHQLQYQQQLQHQQLQHQQQVVQLQQQLQQLQQDEQTHGEIGEIFGPLLPPALPALTPTS